MRRVIDISVSEVIPSASAVLLGQGVPEGANPDARLAALVDQALDLYQELCRPVGLMMDISTPDFRSVYNGEGDNAEITPLKDIYPRSDQLALFAATVGEDICGEIARRFDESDYAMGAMLDTAASEGAELAGEFVRRQFERHLVRIGCLDDDHGTLPFSPGYCGWNVSGQKKLFARLNPEEAGISLSESCLMQPLKSVSGVIVAGPKKIFDFEDSYPFCARCRNRNCRERLETLYAKK